MFGAKAKGNKRRTNKKTEHNRIVKGDLPDGGSPYFSVAPCLIFLEWGIKGNKKYLKRLTNNFLH